MIALLRIAGIVQLIFIGANFVLPKRLHFERELQGVAPILRQIFLVHHAYIVLVLGFFAFVCLFFTRDLAGASRLGTTLCTFMALFWLARIPIQFFFYDAEVRKRYPLEHCLFSLALVSVAAVLSAAALRGIL